MCVGFVFFVYVEEVPSPKSHVQTVGLPMDISLNCTVRGATPDMGVAEKSAIIVEFVPPGAALA